MAKQEKQRNKRDEAMAQNGWLSVAEVADKLGVHQATIYRMVENVELESRKLLNKTYISVKSAIAHVGEDNARILGLVFDDTAALQPTAPVSKKKAG